MYNDFIINNKVYHIASKTRIFFARFFDFIFSSIPTIILAIIFNFLMPDFHNVYVVSLILIIIGFFWLLIYFVFIPWCCKTKTLGKLIFGLILYKKGQKKIKLWEILVREIFIIFIPWVVGVVTNIISCIIFKININNIAANSQTLLIMRITTSFYVIWYVFMLIGLIIDKKNQLFFDFYLNIHILFYIKNLDLKNLDKSVKQQHIHLNNNQPGNINDEVLKELVNDPESEN